MTGTSFEQNLHTRPYRTIFFLSWPVILMMGTNFLIGFTDVWVAGQIGKEVQASMGLMTQMLMFFVIIASALASGSVAAISQSLGARLHLRAHRCVGLGLLCGAVFGICILLLGTISKEILLDLLHIPKQIRPITNCLLKIYLYIMPANYLLILCSAFFRAYKQMLFPLYATITVCVLNAIGDLGLGLGWFGFPELGYSGLAWSTFFSLLGGALLSLVMLARRGILNKKSFACQRWNKAALPYLVKVAWPSASLQLAWNLSYMVLLAIVAALPQGNVDALAGMSAGMRIESMLFLPGAAFNLICSILVGHYLGAGQEKEARTIGYQIIFIGVVLVCFIGIVLWIYRQPVIAFLCPQTEVQVIATDYLRYNMLALPFMQITITIGGAFAGAGATLYQMGIVGCSAWFIRLPLAWWMGHVLLGSATGIWISMLVSQIAQCALTTYFYHFGNWPRFAQRKIKS